MTDPKISEWGARIDEITETFRVSFEPLSSEQLNWKPSPQVWSVAENLEHLILVNESYYPVVEEFRRNTPGLPFVARFGFIPKLLGNFILKSVQPHRRKKIKTFPIWEPSRSKISNDILGRFASHQQELKSFIKKNSDLIEKNVIICSPANKNIVYPITAAIEIMVTHEMRHYNQAREVMAMQMQQPGF